MKHPIFITIILFSIITLSVFVIGVSIGLRLDKPNVREYQFEVNEENYKVYDGERLVGTIEYTGKSGLDSLIDKDNE